MVSAWPIEESSDVILGACVSNWLCRLCKLKFSVSEDASAASTGPVDMIPLALCSAFSSALISVPT